LSASELEKRSKEKMMGIFDWYYSRACHDCGVMFRKDSAYLIGNYKVVGEVTPYAHLCKTCGEKQYKIDKAQRDFKGWCWRYEPLVLKLKSEFESSWDGKGLLNNLDELEVEIKLNGRTLEEHQKYLAEVNSVVNF
jgi:hypothetical protein